MTVCVTEQNRWSLKVNLEKYLATLKPADITLPFADYKDVWLDLGSLTFTE